MKKLIMMLVVMALLMAFPVAAVAKKPAQPPGQEPFPGLTCQAWFESHDETLWQVGIPDDFPVEEGDFRVTLTPAQPAACIDVTSAVAGVWNFEIDAVKVASFNMQIKDSVPGDMCWRDAWSNKKASLPDLLSTPEIPIATINACPGDDFTDGGYAEPEPSIDHPLVFGVAYSPERRAGGSSLTITVTLPEPEIP